MGPIAQKLTLQEAGENARWWLQGAAVGEYEVEGLETTGLHHELWKKLWKFYFDDKMIYIDDVQRKKQLKVFLEMFWCFDSSIFTECCMSFRSWNQARHRVTSTTSNRDEMLNSKF